jgi:hypothetical protein
MKRTLSEEVERMHKIMGLEEQKWLDKVKTAAQNVGNKIQAGVNQVMQNTPHQTAATQQNDKTLEQVRAEWSKINTDLSNSKGFGEGVSKDESLARQMAELNGRAAILKKMGKTSGSISANVIDQKLFANSDGTYDCLVIMGPI